jgi:hypothetical protein
VSLETIVPGYLTGRGNEQFYSTLRETAGR